MPFKKILNVHPNRLTKQKKKKNPTNTFLSLNDKNEHSRPWKKIQIVISYDLESGFHF